MDESISFLKVGPDVSFGVIGSDRELGIDGDAMQFGTSQCDHDVANILLLSAFGCMDLSLIEVTAWSVVYYTNQSYT